MNAFLPVNDINGLLPALERRVVQGVHVLEGENFLMDVKGPYTAFGTSLISYQPFTARSVATFRIDDNDYLTDIFLVDDRGFWSYDSASDTYYFLFEFTTSFTQEWPWSYARVGGSYYFCKKGSGVIRYELSTGLFTTLSSNVPTTPHAVTEALGRLVILGAERLAWSAQDDGTDLAPSLVTGAGFQGLSRVGGRPLAVKGFGDGFLTFTTAGIMRSEYTQIDGTPFRHYPLQTEAKLISPFMITTLKDKSHIFIDKSGFFKTNGGPPERWDPVFSEYLKTILKDYDLTQAPVLKLSVNLDREWMFLSLSSDGDTEIYDQAFVRYIPTEKWGSFNWRHLAFGELHIHEGADAGFNFGYLDDNGAMNGFRDFPSREPFPDILEYFYQQSQFDQPMRFDQDGVWKAAAYLEVSAYNLELFEDLNTGWYDIGTIEGPIEPVITDEDAEIDADDDDVFGEDWNNYPTTLEDWLVDSGDEDWGAGPAAGTAASTILMLTGFGELFADLQPRAIASVNGRVRLGLVRWQPTQWPDETTYLTDVRFGFPNSADDEEFEDWLTMADQTEDWNSLTGFDDWGEGIFETNDFDVDCIGTDDGENQYMDEFEELLVVQETRASRQYAAARTAIYHMLDVRAQEVRQSFHLTLLEFSGTLAGRRG